MNPYDRQRLAAERYRKLYPPGTRLMLIYMEDPYSPVPSGTRGTVKHIDDIGQIFMKWDNGRSLPIVPDVDQFRALTPRELEEEQMMKAGETESFSQRM